MFGANPPCPIFYIFHASHGYEGRETDVTWKQPDITPQQDLQLLRKNYASESDIPDRYLADQCERVKSLFEFPSKDRQRSL